MIVLDLRPFEIVEGVGFNELFKLVPNPFSNPNFSRLFRESRNFRVPIPILKKCRVPDPTRYFTTSCRKRKLRRVTLWKSLSLERSPATKLFSVK